MDLRLKFISVNESDVIATSSLCSYSGTNPAYKYDNDLSYYKFVDENGVFAGQNGCFGVTYIIDKNGNNLGNNVGPDIGKHYHYDKEAETLYECNDETHYGTLMN